MSCHGNTQLYQQWLLMVTITKYLALPQLTKNILAVRNLISKELEPFLNHYLHGSNGVLPEDGLVRTNKITSFEITIYH